MSDNQQLTSIIKKLCATGYQYYDQGDYDQALRTFYQAWVQLPKPQTDFPQAGWTLAAIGDCYFKMGKQPQAQQALESCLCCPDMSNSPFVRLRLGQSLLDSGQVAAARKQLLKAYQLAGKDQFQLEAPKYINAIEDLIV